MTEDLALVVDQDPRHAAELADRLGQLGCRALEASSLSDAAERLHYFAADLLFLDDATRLKEGARPFSQLMCLRPGMQAVLMVPKGSLSSVVEAMKTGAVDCLAKPVHDEQLRLTLENCRQNRLLESEIALLKRKLDGRHGLARIVGNSPGLNEAAALARKVADYPVSVLLEGESGTGKELFARAIHEMSGRSGGPFVALDCSVYPHDLVESELFGFYKGAFTGASQTKPGRLEVADGGTLFIDEVGNLPLGVQMKLLRVLQARSIQRLGSHESRPLDLRLVCATNIDLRQAIAAGRFREDLFHRINEFPLRLPPLRARGDDVELLARFFLHRFRLEFGRQVEGFSDNAMALLRSHPWPGNIRELRNAVKQAVILAGSRIEAEHLPAALLGSTSPDGPEAPSPGAAELPEGIQPLWSASHAARAAAERRHIEAALAAARWNRAQAARLLGVHTKTLYKKLREYGMA